MSNIHIHLNQDTIALDGFRPNSLSQITGYIESSSVPSLNIQLQLIGKEEIGETSRVIIDDTFHLSKSDWMTHGGNYRLPFTVPVPNNIPISFQMKEDMGGIHYVIQVYSHSRTVIHPIAFYRTYRHNTIPRRVFWGIAKESSSKWQYELEFPSAFDLSSAENINGLTVRLRSNSKDHSVSYCLITCQIIQSVHLKGCESQHHVLMTTSELLGTPNATWFEPCYIHFELGHPMLLPTVRNQGLSVSHSIRISCIFSTLNQSNNDALNFEFPLDITGVLSPLLCSTCSTTSSNSSMITNMSDETIQSIKKDQPKTNSLKSFLTSIPFFQF